MIALAAPFGHDLHRRRAGAQGGWTVYTTGEWITLHSESTTLARYTSLKPSAGDPVTGRRITDYDRGIPLVDRSLAMRSLQSCRKMLLRPAPRAALLLAAALLLIAFTPLRSFYPVKAAGHDPEWQQVGLAGITIHALALGAKSSSPTYAGAENGVYRLDR